MTKKSTLSNNRIAFFMYDFVGGGAERVIVHLANQFAKKSISVDLIVLETIGPRIDALSKEVNMVHLLSNSFRHQYLPRPTAWMFREPVTKIPLLKYLIFSLMLSKYLRKKEISLLVTTFIIPSIISLVVKKYLFKKITLTVRIENTFSEQLKHIITSTKCKWKTYGRIEIFKFLLPSANTIITVSKGAEKDIKRHIPPISHLVHTIYNPVVSSYIGRQMNKPVFHPWINRKDCKIILTANRLHPLKDMCTLIRAFAETLKTMPSSHLIILGEGPEKSKLENLGRQLNIYKFIDFVGFKNNPYSWMAKAHVFVLSSLSEGLSSVLIEAMACGTPVVSTDCPHGPREVLQDGKFGRLVPVGDYKQLSFAILETLKNSIPSDLLIKRASDFSIESSVESHRKLFNSIADSHMLFSK